MTHYYTRLMREKGQKHFSTFEIINTMSFSLLAGNVLTLLLLQLGAGDLVIGIFNSFVYVSFFFMPFGRSIVRKIGLVKNFSRAWIIRYLGMIPALFIPVFFGDSPSVAIFLILTGYLIFQVFRGLGIVSINPILMNIAGGKTQGQFLSRMQILVHSGAIIANIAAALLVGPDAPLWRYSLSIGLGLILGFIGTNSFRQIPEPPGYIHTSQSEPPLRLDGIFREQFKEPSFKIFITSFILMIFFTSMYRPFLTVYAKQYHQLADSTVLLFNLIGSLGAITMGIVNRVMMDRLGAKPMMMIFTLLTGFSSILMFLNPFFPNALGLLLLGAMFYLSVMGIAGGETSSQGYFFSIMPKKHQLELGMLYYLLMGVAGFGGSILGGMLLNFLRIITGNSISSSFGWFFFVTFIGITLSVLSMIRLEPLSGKTMSEALGVLLSLRDWRAMSLVKQLDKSKSLNQEQAILQGLRSLGSGIALDEVLERLESPVLKIRREALNTLQFIPYNSRIEDALIGVLEESDPTSVVQAVFLLGKRGSARVVPLLLLALDHDDPYICANAAIALAELGHEPARQLIETKLITSLDPIIHLHCTMALGMFKHPQSIPILHQIAERPGNSQSVIQEIAFALGTILELEESIHREYHQFLENRPLAVREIADTLGGNYADEILRTLESDQLKDIFSRNSNSSGSNPYLVEAGYIHTHNHLLDSQGFSFLYYALVCKGLARYYEQQA
jgi:MFS family permease